VTDLTNTVATSPANPDVSNLRALPRTALFVAATIIIDDQVDPVRVRNLSQSGALLEGAVLPRPGSWFELVRAHLRVSARAMWVCGKQCGALFGEAVDIGEWMTPSAPTQQQRIDALFHKARCQLETRQTERVHDERPSAPASGDPILTAIELLKALDGTLVLDPHMQTNYPDHLRALKTALNLLRRSGERVAS
jgi:hypothetical protein